jgi:YD repeat-containing protein
VFDDAADDFVRFSYENDTRRIAQVALWHEGEELTVSKYTYGCTPYTVSRTDLLDGEGTERMTTVRNDAMGRAAHTWVTTGPVGTAAKESYTRKEFDTLGRIWRESLAKPFDAVSNPCSHLPRTPDYWIYHYYDVLGREVLTKSPAPGSVGVDYEVMTDFGVENGLHTELVTEMVDGQPRWRKLWKDTGGRLVRVDEQDPDHPDSGFWQTAYNYDWSDRLTRVDKKKTDGSSGQVRVFAYNDAGWLMSAQLPEYKGATMLYDYDDLGNLTRKHLAQQLPYNELLEYDHFGRLKSRTVSYGDAQDPTDPPVTQYTYEYESLASGITAPPDYPGEYTAGRLVRDRVQYGEGSGRVAIERFFRYNWQGLLDAKAEVFGLSAGDELAVDGEGFQTRYDLYDRLGNLVAMHYPSGVLVDYGYGAGGSLERIGIGGHPLFEGIEYATHGAAARMAVHDPAEVTYERQVNWVQMFHQRQWPEKILNGAGASACPGGTRGDSRREAGRLAGGQARPGGSAAATGQAARD